jgi:pilus assembly protein Flp/PilA
MPQFDILAAWLKAKVKSERGATLVEYALLVALIAVVCIAAISFLAGRIGNNFSSVGSSISGA